MALGFKDEATAFAVRMARIKRGVEKRDRKIAALERKVLELQRKLADHDRLDAGGIVRAVQRAILNVRLIPLMGLGDARVLDVHVHKTKEGG